MDTASAPAVLQEMGLTCAAGEGGAPGAVSHANHQRLPLQVKALIAAEAKSTATGQAMLQHPPVQQLLRSLTALKAS